MPNLQRSTAEHHYLAREAHTVAGAFRSDAGPARLSNEDNAALVLPTDLETLEQRGVLALVADGMGGHDGGEVASELTAAVVPEFYYEASGDTYVDPRQLLVDAMQAANRRIFAHAAEVHALAGMGSTCTVLVLRAGFAWCAHVGDSRAYLLRDGGIYRMTQDHSATMALVNQGLLTLAEARRHEDRNVILRAMGTHAEVEVATWTDPFPVRTGDRFVLCSDGLHDTLSDDEISEICLQSEDPEAICDALMGEALAREASDNVTVLVLCVRSPQNAERADSAEGEPL